jgi:formylglycine-generating enzyme required for sulfatase activity
VGEATQYARRALHTLLVGRHQTPDIAGPGDSVTVASAGEAGPDLGDFQRMMDGGADAPSDAPSRSEFPAPTVLPAPSPLPQPRPSPQQPPPATARGCAANQVAIPGGTFRMGSADGDSDEKPVHRVTLSPYCMDKTEVTVAAYRACLQQGGCLPPKTGFACTWGKAGKDDHPINCVRWNQAKTYCEWIGGRLPSEAEWEFAARGNDGRMYPWGNEEPGARLCWDGEGNDLGKGNRKSTCPVGRYPAGASPFGVLDMVGNVSEWTADSYGRYSADAQRNPARSGPYASPRVIRGGSWNSSVPSWVHAASRNTGVLGSRSSILGFRCAR